MAGLRHNPAAPYCVKRSDGSDAPPLEPDARCDYCAARGLDPRDTPGQDASAGDSTGPRISAEAITEGTIAAHSLPAASMLTVPEPLSIRNYLTAVGYAPGERFDELRLSGGERLGAVIIDAVWAGPGMPTTIRFREEGTPRTWRVALEHVVTAHRGNDKS